VTTDAQQLEQATNLLRAGRVAEASEAFTELSQTMPENAEVWHLLGIIGLQQGKLAEAEALLKKAIGLSPSNAKYHNNLGNVYFTGGRFEDAAHAYKAGIDQEQNIADPYYGLGNALRELGRVEGAEAAYRTAIEINPEFADAYCNLAVLFKGAERIEDMEAILMEGYKRFPKDPKILWNLCDYYESRNRLEDAFSISEQLTGLGITSPEILLQRARIERRREIFENAITHLKRVINTSKDPGVLVNAHFEMGLSCDRAKFYADAYQAFSEGNRLQREMSAQRGIRAGQYVEQLERIHSWFTPDRLSKHGGSSATLATDGYRDPVFFVGFPRSGTTLVEQVLAAHPNLETTDEKSPVHTLKSTLLESLSAQADDYPACLDQVSEELLRRATDDFWASASETTGADLREKRLVDKLPLNIVELGLISLVFPQAKVLVALRDPRDVCLSCFMQQFRSNIAMANFNSMADTVRLYEKVMGLWRHYRTNMPLPWHEYRYEDVVVDFDTTVSGILAFIGEDWHDDIRSFRDRAKERAISTPSYRDVTSPLYKRAVGRWESYRGQIEDDIIALEPFLDEFGYSS